MTADVAEEKRLQRARGVAARNALTKAERAARSELVCKRLLALDEYRRADVIFSYRAMPDELDVSAFNRAALLDGKTVAYPYCADRTTLYALVPDAPDDLPPGRYGIPAPVPERARRVEPASIALVIVPCAAFDASLARMGMGAGYYDRFLPGCTRAKKVLAAFEAQRLERIVCDAHDVPMDAAVTEQRVYRPAE